MNEDPTLTKLPYNKVKKGCEYFYTLLENEESNFKLKVTQVHYMYSFLLELNSHRTLRDKFEASEIMQWNVSQKSHLNFWTNHVNSIRLSVQRPEFKGVL